MFQRMKKISILYLFCCCLVAGWAEEIHVQDPQSWSSSQLAPYVGQTVTFDVPMYLLSAHGSYLSPSCVSSSSASNAVYLSGAPSTQRPRTYSTNLSALVTSSNKGYGLQYVSGTFDGNTRETLLKGPDLSSIDTYGTHTLLVCATNLEYYLVKNLGTGFGPDNQQQHDAQRSKVRQALALINADIYGICEIEQGTAALQEICTDLNTAHTDRRYVFVNNATSSSAGSYTMSAFIYDSLKVRSIGECKKINAEVLNRKFMQCFQERSTDEKFIFSMNHFKAMTGSTDTESRRIAEANAVNSAYDSYSVYCDEKDLLIMGDLNCYYNSKPISILLENSCTDLHRYFHPEGSYSYVYAGHPGYLDHAICNSTLLPQITGMLAYHVNSDENDCYTYDGSCNDGTMFRYSDHDPILVGLRLKKGDADGLLVLNYGSNLGIENGAGGYIRIYDVSGNLLYQRSINSNQLTIFPDEDIPAMRQGCYVLHVFHNGVNKITKYIRP